MSNFAENPLFPKPFTAKKKRNLRHFSPMVSCTRLRRIQEFIQSDGNSRPKLDGILCILGVDGRYNSGSKQLLNYLLFGFCELLTSEISGGKITDEELEDVIVLVKAASVHVYCNPLNYPYLLRYIAHWRNLQLHCLNKEEYDDNERAEEFKITSFISMVQGCEHIGIQYGEPSLGEKQPQFDPFILEKWPLIQAYAFEDFGSGGFFTMKHKVIDVTGHLNSMYGSLDPAIVQNLIHETLPLFERHFKSVVTNIDAESHSELLKVTERTLSEPIVSYFTHGHITDKENSKRSTADCQPFVLLGSHSSRQNIKTSDRESSLNNNTTVGNSGINGNSAKHLVCFAVDPKGILKCARTYFLQNGFVPISVTDIGETSSLRHSKDLRLLINLYLLAIDAVMKGVEIFSKTSNWQESFSAVLSELKSGLEKRKIDLMKSSFLSDNVKFSVDACDSLGRVVNLDKQHLVIKRVCLYLYDIPSIEHPGCTLGSVVFGETFLDSTIMKLVPGSIHENNPNSSFLLLTENIPRFVSWQGGGKEKEMSKQMEAFAKSKCDSEVLGKQLIYCGEVFVASPVNRWEAGCLYIYQQGFLFVHARLGVVLLPTSKLSRLQFQDMGDTSTMALLVLTYHPSIMDNLPSHLLTEQSYLVLAFTSDSHVYRQLYADVIHLWKDNQLPSYPPFETVTDLPEYLQESLSCLGKQHLHLSSASEELLPSLKSFLRHLSVSSSFAEKPLQAEDLQILLGDKPHEPRKQLQDFELLLTVLTGAPQSGKDSLCRALMALAKENSKWLVWQRPEDNSDPFDPKVLQDSLATMLSSQRRLHTSGKRPRVIIVTPGFTDVMDVIRAVKTHPDAEVAKCLRIGAVTCCVDPLNCFMENRLTLPKLLEQCAQGWVNNVVFTRCLESQNPQLSLIQTLVRGCNPDVAFILAKGGEVTRTPDVELILSDSAFDESSMVQNRLLMCPGWSLGLFPSGAAERPVSEIKVPFYAPLQKSLFAANLKALHGPISLKEIRQTGAVHSLQGRVCFSEEGPHKEVRVRWARLNGVLRMNTVENATAIPRPPTTKSQPNGDMNKAPEYYIIFTGFNLHEEALRDWLKTCCKPGPIKEKLKTRKDLSKDELTKISSAHKFDPLPPGWFYNGLHFVSLNGEKDYSHPLLETFIESYLMQINEEIKRRNLIVDHTPKVDIFTRP